MTTMTLPRMSALKRLRAKREAFPARSFPSPAPPLSRGEPFELGAPPGAARWIAVAGIGDDAGTTTVAALLSLAYATHRRYRIVAVDAHPVGGALGARIATRAAAGVAQIAAAAPDLSSFDALSAYLDQSAEGMWAVTGAATTAPEPEQCRVAVETLSRFFALGVLDCGPIGPPLVEAVLDLTHAHLLVAPATPEGVLSAAGALDWLGARRDSADPWHTGVALVSTSRQPNTDVGWATRLLAGRGGRAIPVPYDSGLVTGRISPASVSDGVWTAARRLASEMLSRAARPRTVGWGG